MNMVSITFTSFKLSLFSIFILLSSCSNTGSIIYASLPGPEDFKYVYVDDVLSNSCSKIISHNIQNFKIIKILSKLGKLVFSLLS